MSDTIITQRGFIAFDNPAFILNTDNTQFQNIFNQIKNGKPIVNTEKHFSYHLGITEIFNALDKDDSLLRSFKFREDALKAILSAFNTISFYDWSKKQIDSQFLTSNHIRFLNETFNFIKTGERAISIESWLRILELRFSKPEDRKTTYEINQVFESGNGDYIPIMFDQEGYSVLCYTIDKVISQWTSQPTGWKDLIYFCYIVFGKDESTNVFNRKYA